MPSDPPTPVEIVAVGRELIDGRTVDANSAWIAARLGALGGVVGRIVVVDDDPAAVAREIVAAREHGATFVVTTGGLGPTFDDRTLAGVAAAVGRPLVEDPVALDLVARRYAELARDGAVTDAALTPTRRKMALLPAGARAVPNPVGTAPGVLVEEPAFAVLALPGVPTEMRAVFAEAEPALRARLAGPRHVAEREVASGSGDESIVTIAAARVMAAVPGVQVKSLATAFAPDCDLRVRLTASGTDPAAVEARLARAAERLREELTRLGLRRTSMERFRHVPSLVAFAAEKMRKVGLVDTPSLFCDVYCFEPGQEQAGHRHAVGDKLYFVVSGEGRIRVGDDERDVRPGDLVCAPAGEAHAVRNPGPGRLAVLAVMAPKPVVS